MSTMSSKTKFSKNDFVKILSNYELGEYSSYKYFPHGGVQTTVLITTTKGRFILRHYATRPEKHVMFEINLLRYLHKKKYPCPVPIASKRGFVRKYKNKPYAIFEYIEGKHAKNPNNVTGHSKQFSIVAKSTARLNKITKGYKPINFKDHQIYDTKYCLRKYKSRNKNRLKWMKNELKKLKFPNNMPKGVCHCDLNYGNFLFNKSRFVGLLDFDMSCYIYLAYDLASLIYWWAWPPKKGLKVKTARYLVKEYSKIRKLNKSEKKHTYDFLKLIILLGISWSDEKDFAGEKRKIDYLNSTGRKEFFNILFK